MGRVESLWNLRPIGGVLFDFSLAQARPCRPSAPLPPRRAQMTSSAARAVSLEAALSRAASQRAEKGRITFFTFQPGVVQSLRSLNGIFKFDLVISRT